MANSTSAWRQMRALPPDVWIIALATLINRMGMMVFPFIILYFNRELGFDLTVATGIAAFYGLGSACAAPIGGWLADRFDTVKVLAIGMGIAGLALIGFPFVRGTFALSIATFTIALLSDISRPSTLTALARLGHSATRRDAFALNYIATNLGMSIGPLTGGYLATISYSYLFWVDGASSIIAGGFLALSGVRAPIVKLEKASSSWNIGRPAFKLVFWLTIAVWVFISFFIASPVYLVDTLKRPESSVGWLWLFNTGVIVFLGVHVNYWTRKISLRLQLCWSALLFALGYLLLFWFSGLGGLVCCILVLTVGEMMLFTNGNTYLHKVAPADRLGKAMAFNSITFSIANSCSTPTVGYFFSAGSPQELWLLLLAVGLFAAWGFYRLPESSK